MSTLPLTPATQSRFQRLGAVVLLGLMSGSSIVILRLGVIEIPPLSLVMLRQIIATLAFSASVLALRRRLPGELRVWRDIAVVAALTTILPVIFFTVALKFVSSAVASITLALVPLFTGLLANFLLRDEKLSLVQGSGLVLAFSGVVLLMMTGTTGIVGGGSRIDLRGYLLLLITAMALASAAIYTRRHLQHVDVLVNTACQTAFSLLIAVPLALMVSPFDPAAITWRGWLAVGWSGLLDSFAGFFLFFYLIQRFGPTLATLSIYITPVVSAVMGVLILDELINASLLICSALILAGVYLTGQQQHNVADRS